MNRIIYPVRMAAFYMLQELKEQRLEVIKVNYLRKVISENPEWYRKLCSDYVSSRKRFPRPRTIIKRCHVIKVLIELSKGIEKQTVYHQRLIGVCNEFHSRMY